MINKMIDLVVSAHKGQLRKSSGLPYVFHPFEVAKKISDWGIGNGGKLGYKDFYIILAALGHDLLEDTNATEEQIKAISEEALSIIKELTWSGKGKSDVEQFEYWCKFADECSTPALITKIADRYCNVYDFARSDPRPGEAKGQYAAIYAFKIFPVYRGFMDRKEEVASEYGWIATDMIINDVQTLTNAISQHLCTSIWGDFTLEEAAKILKRSKAKK